MKHMQSHQYTTKGGIEVYRASIGVEGQEALRELVAALDHTQGVLFSSSYDYPGRYTRWDLGFSAPPLSISASGRRVYCRALNERGMVILQMLQQVFANDTDFADLEYSQALLAFVVCEPLPVRYEEERSRRRTVFTALRRIIAAFSSREDDFLGLYGAFGYDLAFQFEEITQRLPRGTDDRDLLLYLPDNILVVDHRRESAQQHFYDFALLAGDNMLSTRQLSRAVQTAPFAFARSSLVNREPVSDHAPGAYAGIVRKALQAFACGDLFEVVPGQTFTTTCQDSPSALFRRLQQQNPAPYGALLNLGQQEYLVAASPEMYVRVEGRNVETCPISGTIARGRDAMEDAEQIRRLLNSAKDEAELSMCTDVDRNDKSRVCVPGSVQVTGRRLVEMYSRLIHTVDHVKGVLRPEFDALDAFLAHAWAVTVTGAPKHAAMQFLENHEHSQRHWYGGAMGCLNFNGNLNTGLTIRTIRIKDGMAQVRAGATLLADSNPEAEEMETRLKASALLGALKAPAPRDDELGAAATDGADRRAGLGLRILMVDHQDSFVHTLSSYLRETGAMVRTIRPAAVAAQLHDYQPDLVVLSPGPGRPQDFAMADSIKAVLAKEIPLFGVCLGLQGVVEFFGGSLQVLATPMHGKQSALVQMQGPLFEGLPEALVVGRYHSLAAAAVPECLQVCARSDDGVVMALQHRHLPVFAVQFHPESILTAQGGAGQRMLCNILRAICKSQA